eukprot:1179083-Prymnesium_polylepis.2
MGLLVGAGRSSVQPAGGERSGARTYVRTHSPTLVRAQGSRGRAVPGESWWKRPRRGDRADFSTTSTAIPPRRRQTCSGRRGGRRRRSRPAASETDKIQAGPTRCRR